MSNQEEDFLAASDQVIRERILHTLSIYPEISPTMLQVGIGTALSSKMWHPMLERLVSEGLVQRTQRAKTAPNGRDLTHTIISLTELGKEKDSK